MSDMLRRLTSDGVCEPAYGQRMAVLAAAKERETRAAIERGNRFHHNMKTLIESVNADAGKVRGEFDAAGVHFSRWAASIGFNEAAIKKMIAKAFEQFVFGLPYCESHIERKILPWLIFQDFTLSGSITPVWTWRENMPPFQADVLIVPQMAILNHRFDFCVLKKSGAGQVTMVVLECDGFAHHNVNKDLQRDGRAAMLGIRTVRASSDEIQNSPRSVVRRVAEALTVVGE